MAITSGLSSALGVATLAVVGAEPDVEAEQAVYQDEVGSSSLQDERDENAPLLNPDVGKPVVLPPEINFNTRKLIKVRTLYTIVTAADCLRTVARLLAHVCHPPVWLGRRPHVYQRVRLLLIWRASC